LDRCQCNSDFHHDYVHEWHTILLALLFKGGHHMLALNQPSSHPGLNWPLITKVLLAACSSWDHFRQAQKFLSQLLAANQTAMDPLIFRLLSDYLEMMNQKLLMPAAQPGKKLHEVVAEFKTKAAKLFGWSVPELQAEIARLQQWWDEGRAKYGHGQPALPRSVEDMFLLAPPAPSTNFSP